MTGEYTVARYFYDSFAKEGYEIESNSFEKFWLLLREKAEGVEMDARVESGNLKMQWSFKDQAKMQIIIECLKEHGVKYLVSGSSVCFWVTVDEKGQLSAVKD